MFRSIAYCFALIILLFGCENDEPNYPAQPFIEFKALEFKDLPKGPDSLILTFKFRDGDKDLGLDPTDRSYPFHRRNYYLTSSGTISPVNDYLLDVVTGGKLVTPNTRLIPGYEYLPPNEYPFSCTHYVWTTFNLTNLDIIDENDNAYSVEEITDFNLNLHYYKVTGTFYSTENQNYNNLYVDFFTEETNGEFKEFNWVTDISPPGCGIDFHERFPKPSGSYTQAGPFKIKMKNKYEGEITYNMASHGFTYLFTDKRLMLRIRVRDHALNESNIIETSPFTLEELKK